MTVGIGLLEHLGDIVAAEPIARHARQQFPESRICWFVTGRYRELVDRYTAVDAVVTVSCLTEWLLLWSLGATDVVWDLHLNGRMCLTCMIPMEKSGAAGAIVFDNYYHLGCLLAVQCMCAGIEPLHEGPTLSSNLNAAVTIDALRLPPRFIAIHCTSNDPSRDWSTECWIELVEYLTTTLAVQIVEVGLVPRAILSDTARARNLCGLLSIPQTIEVIRRSALFVGIDSGPAQIANAVGTQGVIIMGHFHQFDAQMPYTGFYTTEAGATILRADGPAASMLLEPVITAINCRLSGQA